MESTDDDETIDIGETQMTRLRRNAQAECTSHEDIEEVLLELVNEYVQDNDGSLAAQPVERVVWLRGNKVGVKYAKPDA